jgi:aspartate aminotransferase-like enzyme
MLSCPAQRKVPFLENEMPALLPHIDPQGLLEFSVVFTDRSLNHMSQQFQGVMRDVSATLKEVYKAKSVAIVPGGGTYGMESIARQFGTGKKCMVLRNGWFSYRWTQIFEMGSIPSQEIVLKARRQGSGKQAPFTPAPIEEVVAEIQKQKPDVLFAPHVETAAGLILPDDYMRKLAAAMHAVGGLFVLDCVASGTLWVDMVDIGVDVLLTAPQKGWSGSPGCALIMFSELARQRIDSTTSTSYSADLKKWLQIMESYEKGGHAYHATMPTDTITALRKVMNEARAIGFAKLKAAQQELGDKVRAMLERQGIPSVAAAGFKAPGVVVSYTEDAGIQSSKKFVDLGLQTAAGVPLQCDEGADYQSFRIGLFGLDKLQNIDRTVQQLETALEKMKGPVAVH